MPGKKVSSILIMAASTAFSLAGPLDSGRLFILTVPDSGATRVQQSTF
jgi:hypothetical protein